MDEHCVHSFIFFRSHFFLVRLVMDLDAILGTLGKIQEHTPDRTPFYHGAPCTHMHIHTLVHPWGTFIMP